jgi:Cu/Ag efflux pump CusA
MSHCICTQPHWPIVQQRRSGAKVWATGRTKEELIAAYDAILKKAVPGTKLRYSQPIELRVQELIALCHNEVSCCMHKNLLDVDLYLSQHRR